MSTTERPPLEPNAAVALSPLVRRVLCDNPGMMTGPGTNTYLVGTTEVAVIDPGPEDADHLEALVAAGGGRIRWILCTHTHPDHSPGAPPLAERTGAEILAFADRDGLVCTEHLHDGDRVAGPDFTLRAIHTPGHASNHLCFWLEEEGTLFSGDHVMDGSTVVITPLDGDMADYLAAIERLLAWEPPLTSIAPAHGHVIPEPAAKLTEYLEHRREREAQVLDALVELTRRPGADGTPPGEVTTAALVAEIYTDVPEFLHPVARFSVWAHLRKLADEGRAVASDPDAGDAFWRPAPA
jgi:glyoxylase-like metal-dependent hydrolase (beta-lactamase superfamily II)